MHGHPCESATNAFVWVKDLPDLLRYTLRWVTGSVHGGLTEYRNPLDHEAGVSRPHMCNSLTDQSSKYRKTGLLKFLWLIGTSRTGLLV